MFIFKKKMYKMWNKELTAHRIDLTLEAQAESDIFIPSNCFCSCKSLEESQHTLPLYEQKPRGFLGEKGAPV